MKNRIKILLFALTFLGLSAYNQTAPDKYWLQFTNKLNTEYLIDYPEEFLSARSISRRIKHNVMIQWNDLPVDPVYIDSMKSLGLQILNISKWFNAITVESIDIELIDTITNISFIKGKKHVKKYYAKERFDNKFIDETISPIRNKNSQSFGFNYGISRNQIEMLNGQVLHSNGFRGEGMIIAQLDGGYNNANTISALDSMRYNNQVLGTRDFVRGGPIRYNTSWHGTAVLSTMAGNIPGVLIGTAPKANYWLLRCEDSGSEYIIEEDNWVAAAEFADSAGVDIITSSLSYSTYDDESTNHTIQDMDGNTSRVTIGADIAASKGILVVTSAANQGNKPWHYIASPADGDSVLTVGAVDSTGIYAYFSSTGPTADGRIKPDVTAQGLGTVIMGRDGKIGRANGTSFSAPLIAGLAACFWQAYPTLTNMQVLEIIRKSSNRFNYPDSLYGYGIPDFNIALEMVKEIYPESVEGEDLKTWPNPFSNEFSFNLYYELSGNISVEIFDILGKRVLNKLIFPDNKFFNKIDLKDLDYLYRGVYFLRVTNGEKTFHAKLIKQ